MSHFVLPPGINASMLPTDFNVTTLPAGFNITLLLDPKLCTIATCPMSLAHLTYLPSLPGNALYAGIFGIILLAQIFLGIRHRIWGFMGGMIGGILLEIVGYIARIMMHSNPFTKPPFLMYLVCLTIAPAFLSASIYLCLARIVVVFGEKISRFTPRTYTIVFISCDFVALMLQAAGGAIASGANTASQNQLGINIMVAGVSWQVVSLAVFAALCAEFGWRVYRSSDAQMNPNFADLRQSFKFRAFLWALGLATLAIFVRSVFRTAELQAGFHGALANEQVPFMILEGAMIISAVTILTVFHPGLAFAGRFHDAGWKLGTNKNGSEEFLMVTRAPASGSKWAGWMKMGRHNRHVEVEKIVDLESSPEYQV